LAAGLLAVGVGFRWHTQAIFLVIGVVIAALMVVALARRRQRREAAPPDRRVGRSGGAGGFGARSAAGLRPSGRTAGFACGAAC
jgi:membrane protein implicated in regulation of membrane protease activity